MKIIFDASIAAKWFLNEEKSEEARRILENMINNQSEIIAPSILIFELGNIIIANKIKDIVKIKEIIDKISEIGINFTEIAFFEIEKITKTASLYNLSFYDASYVYLAQKLNCEFYTSDKKMFNNVKSRKIKIHLL